MALKQNYWKFLTPITLALAVLILGILWNEARKEIFYLCGNFAPGASRDSVIRQLETGNFLRFEIQTHEGGRRIVADSTFNLRIYRCIVDLDETHHVTRREYRVVLGREP